MKEKILFILLSIISFTACDNYEDFENESIVLKNENLESENLVIKSSSMEYPVYHVTYDAAKPQLDITLDPASKSYDPGPYTHITFTIKVEPTDIYGENYKTYYGAFPIKGHCWSGFTRAFDGKYTVYLYLNGVEFNKTVFYKARAGYPIQIKDGNIYFSWEEFSK